MTHLPDDEAVRYVQVFLKALGLYAGVTGGTFGPPTRAAFDKAMPPSAEAIPPWILARDKCLNSSVIGYAVR